MRNNDIKEIDFALYENEDNHYDVLYNLYQNNNVDNVKITYMDNIGVKKSFTVDITEELKELENHLL